MGTDHRARALQLTEQANAWLDADSGWKASLTAEERNAFRIADLAEAQVHAYLASAEASSPVDLIRLVRKEMAQKIAVAIRDHCSHCAAVALGLGEHP